MDEASEAVKHLLEASTADGSGPAAVRTMDYVNGGSYLPPMGGGSAIRLHVLTTGGAPCFMVSSKIRGPITCPTLADGH